MVETQVFKSPTYIDLPRKTKKDKRVSLNLNTYRNLHHFINNEVKVKYKEQMQEQLEGKTFRTPIEIKFTLHKKNRGRSDRSNALSIVEKFFCDALVELGCIPDDSDEYISETHYKSGEVNKDDPHVNIEIYEREN